MLVNVLAPEDHGIQKVMVYFGAFMMSNLLSNLFFARVNFASFETYQKVKKLMGIKRSNIFQKQFSLMTKS